MCRCATADHAGGRPLGTLICALTIDHVGRRLWFAVSFAAAAIALAALAMSPAPSARAGAGLHDHRLFLRQHHQHRRLSLHARALSDPRARARLGTATAWLRFASIIGPIVVGQMIGARLTPAQIPTCPRCSSPSRPWRRSRPSSPPCSRSRPRAGCWRKRPRSWPRNAAFQAAARRAGSLRLRRLGACQAYRGAANVAANDARSSGGKPMRLLKFLLPAVAAAAVSTAARGADPVKIRASWVAPVSNWASILPREEGSRQAPRQVLRARAGALSGHAADDHRAWPTASSRSPTSPIPRSASPSRTPASTTSG